MRPGRQGQSYAKSSFVTKCVKDANAAK